MSFPLSMERASDPRRSAFTRRAYMKQCFERHTRLTDQSYSAALIRVCALEGIDARTMLEPKSEPPSANQLDALLGCLLVERSRFLEKLRAYRLGRQREKHAGRRQPSDAGLRALYAPDYWRQPSLRLTPWGVWSPQAKFYQCGYIDERGEWAIPPRYQWTKAFTEDLAPARFGGKWGFLNPEGQWAVEPIYSLAGFFLHGEAVVYQADDADSPKGVAARHFVIDRRGRYLRSWG